MWPKPSCIYSWFYLYTAEPTGQLADLGRQDGDLFNEARGDRQKARIIHRLNMSSYFWAEMWQTFALMKRILAGL